MTKRRRLDDIEEVTAKLAIIAFQVVFILLAFGVVVLAGLFAIKQALP